MARLLCFLGVFRPDHRRSFWSAFTTGSLVYLRLCLLIQISLTATWSLSARFRNSRDSISLSRSVNTWSVRVKNTLNTLSVEKTKINKYTVYRQPLQHLKEDHGVWLSPNWDLSLQITLRAHEERLATPPWSKHWCGIFYVPQEPDKWRCCETGPTVFRAYPRRTESLIVCRCHYYKDSTLFLDI